MSMDESTITKVAAILQEWNPLRDRAETIADLDGYRVEAIDVIATWKLMAGPNKIEKATKQVLDQAFSIDVPIKEAELYGKQIEEVICG